LESVGRLL